MRVPSSLLSVNFKGTTAIPPMVCLHYKKDLSKFQDRNPIGQITHVSEIGKLKRMKLFEGNCRKNLVIFTHSYVVMKSAYLHSNVDGLYFDFVANICFNRVHSLE
ncbi:hypothetical protein CEXT_794171 [Caerostris extrusa]|uniref:Uncharacterized protein n=1 Tax=Caerostris extrusa TaxID=172846 RepID=A0AAV4SSF9_CAEEX|nr:hypothetical protein CEXT_794171 [Caerostris extrusa]